MGGITRKFKSGGLHERHVVATWKLMMMIIMMIMIMIIIIDMGL